MANQPAPPAPFGTRAITAAVGSELESSMRAAFTSRGQTESSDSACLESEDSIRREDQQAITALARSLSHLSSKSGIGEGTNTFLDPTSDPELNPNSEQFNTQKWTKNLLRITSRDPDRYPRRTAGVSFRNMNVFGYGTAADYQANVANMWLKGFGWFREKLGYGKKVRIDILRNFEGFVHSGELLVVLGRPGR